MDGYREEKTPHVSRSTLFDDALITHFDVVPGSGSHLLEIPGGTGTRGGLCLAFVRDEYHHLAVLVAGFLHRTASLSQSVSTSCTKSVAAMHQQ